LEKEKQPLDPADKTHNTSFDPRRSLSRRPRSAGARADNKTMGNIQSTPPQQPGTPPTPSCDGQLLRRFSSARRFRRSSLADEAPAPSPAAPPLPPTSPPPPPLAPDDVWSLLEYAARRYPDDIAIVDCGAPGATPDRARRVLTYAQLRARAVVLAQHLARGRGGGSSSNGGSSSSNGGGNATASSSSSSSSATTTTQQQQLRVCILLRNCSEAVELHWACALLRYCVVNLNVALSAEELRRALLDSGCATLVTSADFASVLAEALGAKVREEEEEKGGRQQRRLVVEVDGGGGGKGAGASSPPPPLLLPLRAVVWTAPPSSPARHGGQEDGEDDAALPQQLLLVPTLALSKAPAPLTCSAFPYAAPDLTLEAELLLLRTARRSPPSSSSCSSSSSPPLHLYFTSGTTGRPKMVQLSQAAVAAHALGCIHEHNLTREDVWLHAAPLFHLVDAFAVYSVTLVGGRHTLLPSFTATEFLRCVERERVTVTNVASTMVALAVASPLLRGGGRERPPDLSSLRLVSCGGSPQPPEVVRRAVAAFGCPVMLSYGMTESCGKISMSILPAGVAAAAARESDGAAGRDGRSSRLPLAAAALEQLVCSSGRPFALAEVRVVAEDGGGEGGGGGGASGPCRRRDVEPGSGEAGEVLVRGPAVFDGYCGGDEGGAAAAAAAAAGNAEAFVRLDDDDERLWFRTGDLAVLEAPPRRLMMAAAAEEGAAAAKPLTPLLFLRVVDRKKDMVLVGGENVYCSEVEAALHSHPAVLGCAAFGGPCPLMGERVLAAVTLRRGLEDARRHQRPPPPPSGPDLVRWCAARLAHYKVPSAVHVLDRLPMTGSGKVVKGVLRARFGGGGGGGAGEEEGGVVAAGNDHARAVARAIGAAFDGRMALWEEGRHRVISPSSSVVALPLQGSGSRRTPAEQAALALCRRARHLLLVAVDEPPTDEEEQALARVVARQPGATASVVVVGSRLVAARDDAAANLLRFALLKGAGSAPASSSLLSSSPAKRDLVAVLVPPSTAQQERARRERQEQAAGSVARAFVGGGGEGAPLPLPRVVAAGSASQGGRLAGTLVVPVLLPAFARWPELAAAELREVSAGVSADALLFACFVEEEEEEEQQQEGGALEHALAAAAAGSVGSASAVVLLRAAGTEPLATRLAIAGAARDAGLPPLLAILDAPPLPPQPQQEPPRAPAAAVSARPPAAVAPSSSSSSSSSREASLLPLVQRVVAELLGSSTGLVPPDDPLMAAGLNSTLAVQLAARLGESVAVVRGGSSSGLALPPTLAFDYGSARELAARLAELGARAPGGGGVEEEKEEEAPTAADGADDLLSLVADEAAGVMVGGKSASAQQLAARLRSDPRAPLMASGLNSTQAVALASALSSRLRLALPLPPTLAFDNPSVEAIAEHLALEVPRVAARRSAPPPLAAPRPRSTAQPLPPLPPPSYTRSVVAIVGASHRVAGAAGLNALDNLRAPADRASVVPLSRWDVDGRTSWAAAGAADDDSATATAADAHPRFGGFVRGIESFDAAAFGMSAAESSEIDPQQRMVLTSYAQAAFSCARSGDTAIRAAAAAFLSIGGGSSSNNTTAVFVGVSQLDAAQAALRLRNPQTAYFATGAHLSIASGRVAYCFGLRGPAASVDSACSSGLVVAHLAARALRSGDAVGGAAALAVNATLAASWTLACARAGMLGAEGRCKALDSAADGYVRSEASGALLLALLGGGGGGDGSGGAQPQGIVVLSGSAVNQDGRSSSLTAPRGPAQRDVLRAALADASCSSASSSSSTPWPTLYEMHGTGTALGDPIEAGSSVPALRPPGGGGGGAGAPAAPLLLTAAKSQVGHAEPGAGLVGASRLSAQLRQRGAAAILHLRAVNPYVVSSLASAGVGEAGGVVAAPRQFAPWASAASAASGAVSSFGFGGTNAAAILSMTYREGGEEVVAAAANPLDLQPARMAVAPLSHPLAARAVAAGGGHHQPLLELGTRLASTPALAFLRDHVVRGRALLPAAAMLELALEAASVLLSGRSGGAGAGVGGVSLLPAVCRVSIAAPIVLGEEEEEEGMFVSCRVDAGGGTFEVGFSASGEPWRACASGRFAAVSEEDEEVAPSSMPLPPWVLRVCSCADSSSSGDSALPFASIAAPLSSDSSASGAFVTLPQQVDSAFHLGALGAEAAKIPVAVEAFAAAAKGGEEAGPGPVLACANAADGFSSSSLCSFSLRPCGAAGVAAAISVRGLKTVMSQRLGGGKRAQRQQQKQEAKEEEQQVAYFVEQRVAVPPDSDDNGSSGRRPALRFDLLQSSAAALDLRFARPLQQRQKLSAALAAIGALLPLEDQAARASSALSTSGAAAALQGLLRTVATERPYARVRAAAAPMQGGGVAPRLVADTTTSSATGVPGDWLSVRAEPRGALSNLVLRRAWQGPLGPLGVPVTATDTTRSPLPLLPVAVRAVGVNFRDVLNVLGMYPGADPGEPGSDFAGVALGGGGGDNHDVAGGQAIFGMWAPGGALGSLAMVDTRCVAALPPNASFEEGAAAPTIFLTADAALRSAGGVRRGGRLLLHAAAGGVGLAAMQVARALGASVVVATAGGPTKRALVRGGGEEAGASPRIIALGSRDLSFAHEALALSSGCDAALNSLTSPGFVADSLALLKPGGAFVELGKRDIWSRAAVSHHRPDARYSLLAIDFLPPTEVQRGLRRLAGGMARGELSPPLWAGYAGLASVAAAMRALGSGRTVGKVVVSVGASSPAAASAASAASSSSSLLLPFGQVVITGGTGGLGVLVAGWAVACGLARRVVLLGRSGRLGAEASLAAVSLLGSGSGWHHHHRHVAQITVVAADSSSASDAALVMQHMRGSTSFSSGPVLLMHAAGALRDGLLASQRPSSLRLAAAPKAPSSSSSSSLLEALATSSSAALSTTATVLFSSIASLVGAAGQANYVAANAALDALATRLRAQGAACSAVQWGAWGGSAGMATASVNARLERIGQGVLSPEQGLRALGGVLAALAGPALMPPAAVLAANPFSWPRYLEHLGGVSSGAAELYEDQQQQGRPAVAAATATTTTAAPCAPTTTAAAVDPQAVARTVRSALAEVLGGDAALPDPDAPLVEAGVDSLGAVELAGLLGRRLGLVGGAGRRPPLPSSLVFDYPSSRALTEHLVEQVARKMAAEAEAAGAVVVAKTTAQPPPPPLPQAPSPRPAAAASIAASVVVRVVGLAVRRYDAQQQGGGGGQSVLPWSFASGGGVGDGASAADSRFCAGVPGAAAADMVLPIPHARFGPLSADPAITPTRFGAFVAGLELFDAHAFGMLPGEAATADPQHRLLLEGSAELLVQARGISTGKASSFTTTATACSAGSTAGVFFGTSWTEYSALAAQVAAAQGATQPAPYSAQGAVLSVAAGRVSYAFGLRGPSVVVDTACSSSLVATHLARESMVLSRSCPSALAGGANAMLSPRTNAMFGAGGFLARDGRVKALDAGADGYSRAEGVALALLVRDEEGGGDGEEGILTLALVGSATAQDGASSALTAPSGPRQVDVIRAALAAAALSPADVTAMQGHLTGTALGDGVDVGATMAALCGEMPLASSSSSPSPPPLAVLAAKATVAHAEPASGLIGAAFAAAQMMHRRAAPVLHLRELSPHVEPHLLAAAGERRRAAMVPRQAAPLPSLKAGGGVGGPSLFSVAAYAFQGSNAQVVLQLLPRDAGGQQKKKHMSSSSSSSSLCSWTTRARFWAHPPLTPLLTRVAVAAVAAASPIASFCCSLVPEMVGTLSDHRVAGVALVPGALFFELAATATAALLLHGGEGEAAAAASSAAIADAVVPAPLAVDGSGLGELRVTVNVEKGAVVVESEEGGKKQHLRGRAVAVGRRQEEQGGGGTRRALLPALLRQLVAPAPVATTGLAMASLAAEDGSSGPHPCAATLLPARLDGAMQLGAAAVAGSGRQRPLLQVPAAAALFFSPPPAAAPCGAAAATATLDRCDAQQLVADYRLLGGGGGGGGVLLAGLVARTVRREALVAAATAPDAAKAGAAEEGEEEEESGLEFDDGGGLVRELRSFALEPVVEDKEQGARPGRGLRLRSSSTAAWLAVARRLAADGAAPAGRIEARGPQAALQRLTKTLLVETEGAVAVGTTEVVGEGEVVAVLGGNGGGTRELGAREDRGARFGSALTGARLSPMPDVLEQAEDVQLVPCPPGALSDLKARPLPTAEEASGGSGNSRGHLTLRVEAVGVNFRDLMLVLGLYPNASADDLPGGDCAGVVVGAPRGASSSSPPIGVRVFGLAPGCLGTRATCDPLCVAPVPPHLSPEQAASMPTVFMTAQLALEGALQRQHQHQPRVLVHAAAGGVGLAALQVAKAHGAQVVTTAGGPTKRSCVRQYNGSVSAALGSRDLSFAHEALALASGCDAALNSLTSPGFVAASLSLLKPGASFIEIGKRDIWSRAAVGFHRPDARYSLLAIDFLPPREVQRALRSVAAGAARGDLSPLPLATHALSDAVAALRQMSQARHVGKIVVSGVGGGGNPSSAVPSASALFGGGSVAGRVVVTGGTGALGSLVASWLSRLPGVGEIVLLARSALSTASVSHNSLVPVTIVQADASAAADAGAIACGGGHRSPPIAALLHASGSLADATLANQTPGMDRRAAAPKINALNNLEARLLALQPTARRILFSSVAALLGSAGQSAYAAANAGLDAAAQEQQQQGLSSVSVQWGAWDGAGMASSAAVRRKLASLGMGLLAPSQGLGALSRALGGGGGGNLPTPPAVLSAVPFDWPVFARRHAERMPALLDMVHGPGAAAAATRAAGDKRSPRRPRVEPAANVPRPSAPPPPSLEDLQRRVDQAVATVLGTTTPPDRDAPLLDAGVDSLGAVELRGALQSAFGGLPLPATLLFDHATTSAIARYVQERLGAAAVVKPAVVVAPPRSFGKQRPPPSSSSLSAAVVEVCAVESRMPGRRQRRSSAYAADDAVSRVPLERWRVPGEFGGGNSNVDDNADSSSAVARFGAFLPQGAVERFDAAAFGLGASEAALVDPQQRLVLELCLGAWRQAGFLFVAAGTTTTTNAGVYVGASAVDFDRLLRGLGAPLLPHSATGSLSLSVIPGRVAFALGLQGPAVAYDTACSSSLVALRSAAEELRMVVRGGGGEESAGESAPSPAAAALVAGVNVQLVSSTPQAFLSAAMLSKEGRCKAIDAAADGYVRAEAASALALRRRRNGAAAESSSLPALAIVLGAAVGNDGRSASLTAPSGVAQQRVLREALAQARAAPAEVGLLSMHGTGTPLGDPIECGAIGEVFLLSRGSGSGAPPPPLALAASKARFGHAEPGAGMVAVVTALEAAAHLRVDPVMHLRALNPLIAEGLAAAATPGAAVLPRQQQPAAAAAAAASNSRGRALLVGCSAFAFQGTNAHVLLRVLPTTTDDASELARPLLLQRARRLWPLPPSSALLLSFASSSEARARFVGPALDGNANALAHLRDHVVRGRALVPAAALTEMAAAAVRVLLPSSSAAAAALAAASIPAPLLLPPPSSSSSAPVQMGCDVCLDTGKVEVWSSVRSELRTTHLVARVAVVGGGSAREEKQAATSAAAPRSLLLLTRLLRSGEGVSLFETDALPAAVARVAPCSSLGEGGGSNAARSRAPRALAHPAELDAAFQLGALREVVGEAGTGAFPLRVPVRIEFAALEEEEEKEQGDHEEQDGGGGAWAWAARCRREEQEQQRAGKQASGAVTVDYGLRRGGGVVRVDALEARPMMMGVGATTQPPGSSGRGVEAPPSSLALPLYEAVPLVAGDGDDEDEEEDDDDEEYLFGGVGVGVQVAGGRSSSTRGLAARLMVLQAVARRQRP
jgi:acyl transferase domain-containing protein/acyl-CoA synthetase (AMP-forming)/AMP-acid ligase II/NADPH:quinone reductase-like Zn-dependent oxidoreductase/acyl carrier protein